MTAPNLDEELATVTRETHSFDQCLMHMMHVWYPDRSIEQNRSVINGFYNWQQVFPDENGELAAPFLERVITNMLIEWRAMDLTEAKR